MKNTNINRFDYIFKNGSEIHIGYRSPGFRNLTPPEKMLFAKELGMSVIEPQIAPHEVNSMEAAAAYKRAADGAGIEIMSTGAILPHFKDREVFISGLKQVIEYMKIMGVKYSFTVIPHEHGSYTSQEAWQLTVERTKLAAGIFAENGFTYAIEVDKGCFVETLERAERLIKEADCTNLTINYDPSNFYLNKQDPIKVFDTFKNGISFGHIKDGVQSEGKEVPVGSGEISYKTIFEEMIRYPKKYCMFIEHCSRREQVINAADHIEKVISELLDK